MDGSNTPPTKPKKSRPVRVAEEIKQWVVERDLKKGDKLPNESAMIEEFGVSKGTVREALRILEAQGLIVTKTGPGGGSMVGEVSAERARSLLANYFYFQDLSVADIYQMRRALEPELAASLAGKLSEAQLAELQELAERYPEPAKSSEEEKEQHIASLIFHARLSDFANNRLLGFVIGFMAQILTDLTVYRGLYDPPNVELWRKGRKHQLQLVEALRNCDADRAREIMASHMQVAEDLMRGQEAHLMRRFIGE
ncbi:MULTISPECIES: FadR/GntR family transcriptional regulator [Rhodobacterales]|jgi:DNA-binding FadR family transcriptional regulator|uniref:FadR/GntR family transcriptional regulator n=1 Tax=Rhodobacterales TaxID=204455 RepID=UPI00237FBD8C|nr:FCD domain-containing protein [Phaeobacter gallaeciensis]MDE4096764.1 FCD domain-containing protein [Phaeobacter gallaeciensis]MDE4105942.1 FCD domain-containing protein [Phaeobacter gallaeciensis]MDE4110031.1 FCD domain-containing protein [Phaeobacter gallaeciensis]MDE4114499.1 FCD domain-containing protein [Phaeobacter gallaeciensis]MDE4119335.1 FCD domain-containing protein [Phaeobacter gallaeciensis]